MPRIDMLKQLESYGWTLAEHNPFNYDTNSNSVSVCLEHLAFPNTQVCIEVAFRGDSDGLESINFITVSDDNCDGGGDSLDIYTNDIFNIDVLILNNLFSIFIILYPHSVIPYNIYIIIYHFIFTFITTIIIFKYQLTYSTINNNINTM